MARYEPGETITNEYRVWDDARTEGYIPPGEYRFGAPVEVATVDGETVAQFDWGFTVRVVRE